MCAKLCTPADVAACDVWWRLVAKDQTGQHQIPIARYPGALPFPPSSPPLWQLRGIMDTSIEN